MFMEWIVSVNGVRVCELKTITPPELGFGVQGVLCCLSYNHVVTNNHVTTKV